MTLHSDILSVTRKGTECMPSGRVHMLTGVATTTALTCAFRFPVEVIWVGAFASLLPDIDTRKSILGRWIPMWLISKHRGFTHSLTGACVFTFLCFLCVNNLEITFVFFVGYLSHLFLDATTPMGIQWKWPKKNYYRLRRWK